MFKIEITKLGVKKVVKSAWMSVQELEKLGIEPELSEDGKKTSAYVPRETDETTENKIYEQTVDNFNLKKVIEAINN